MATLESTNTPSEIRWHGDEAQFTRGPVTIASGQGELAAGTVLGVIIASGKFGAYDDDASNGLERAKCILAEDVDATSADVQSTAYIRGDFREANLTGLDAAAVEDMVGSVSHLSGMFTLSGGSV